VLTAWAAVAVCEVASELVGIDARIKWPNDILVDGKKLCGILIEQRTVNLVPGEAGSLGRPATALATVVGIGLNVRQTAADFAGADLPQATSLALCSGTSQSAWDVALALVRRLDVEYGNLAAGVTDPLRQRWIERLGLVGRPIVAELHDGRYEGTLRELAFDRVHIERPGRGVVSLQPEAVRHLELAKESTT
jgi:BirA family biotin operon repressor/biotin-[acetyl-CoA-carboxylase] ligase